MFTLCKMHLIKTVGCFISFFLLHESQRNEIPHRVGQRSRIITMKAYQTKCIIERVTHIIVAFVGDRIPRVLALFHFRVYVTARLITNRERKKRQNQPLRKLNSSIDSDSLHFYALLRSVSSTFFFCEREKKVFGQPCEVAEINEERFGISDSRAYR